MLTLNSNEKKLIEELKSDKEKLDMKVVDYFYNIYVVQKVKDCSKLQNFKCVEFKYDSNCVPTFGDDCAEKYSMDIKFKHENDVLSIVYENRDNDDCFLYLWDIKLNEGQFYKYFSANGEIKEGYEEYDQYEDEAEGDKNKDEIEVLKNFIEILNVAFL